MSRKKPSFSINQKKLTKCDCIQEKGRYMKVNNDKNKLNNNRNLETSIRVQIWEGTQKYFHWIVSKR